MGTSSKHILDKIDRIRAKGDQRRADRMADVRFATTSLYRPATNCKVFTAAEVELAKVNFRKELKKRDLKKKIAWVVTILMTPLAFYFLYLFLFKSF